MSQPTILLTDAVREAARRSVLCWLATVDAQGQPNVSPKEVWAIFDDVHAVVAHIASPISASNMTQQPKVCLSFVDVFVQKGFKLQGVASLVSADEPHFAHWAAPLLPMVAGRFAIQGVMVMRVEHVSPIVAPGYRFYPGETTAAKQVQAALQRYGCSRIKGGH